MSAADIIGPKVRATAADMNTKIKISVRVLTLVVGLMPLCGCDQADPPAQPMPETAVAVKIAHPHQGEIYRYINLPGEVHPLYQVTLFAKIDGYLKTLTVDKGDSVKAGDLIADIEVPELQANLVKYKAEVELAEAEFKEISESPTNNPVGGSPSAAQEAQNRISVAKGKLSLAKANLANTEAMLNYARITAPFDGIITKRFVDPGAYIPVPNAADTPEAAAIVNLTDFKTLRMQVAVPEIEAPHIAIGEPVRWTTDDLPGQNFDGAVTRAYWALNEATKTMLTEVQMTNRDMMLKPGMLVDARIGIEKKENALLVPASAIVKEKANVSLFVLVDGRAKKKVVQSGFNDGTNVEITGGVNLDDSVIVPGEQGLHEGQLVKAAE
jgi:RND family efflux transporter MFP subunit